MNEATRQFVLQHANDDVRLLAFQARSENVDLPVALDQIRGRQIARRKLPSWAAINDIVYPPHLSMEQCSSEQTAQYKAQLLTRLFSSHPSLEEGSGVGSSCFSFTDLTGGFGVDFVCMAKALTSYLSPLTTLKTFYVERNPDLCTLARHNFPLLGLPDVEIICGEAEENLFSHLPSLGEGEGVGLFYLDPARRDEHGARTYGMADCTPNVLAMVDTLMERAQVVIIKLSPMLDWHQAVAELESTGSAHVAEIHIVAVGNECKELLLVMVRAGETSSQQLFCVNDGQTFVVTRGTGVQEFRSSDNTLTSPVRLPPLLGSAGVGHLVGDHLFVPNAAVMKAGCFGALCEQFDLQAVGPNSHLFIRRNEGAGKSSENGKAFNDFPGRCFEITAVSTLNKRELKTALRGITRANIATRNFPLKADELRRRLKLGDGGEVFIFGTTLTGQSHVLLICRKAFFINKP